MSNISPGELASDSAPDPSSPLEDLAVWAHFRLAQAVMRHGSDPSLVWFTRRGLESAQQNPQAAQSAPHGEGVVWYTLAATEEIAEPEDQFDVGVLVEDIEAPAPRPKYTPAQEKRFWVRRQLNGEFHPEPVDSRTVLGFLALGGSVDSAHTPVVTNLGEKLARYKLHPRRLRYDS